MINFRKIASVLSSVVMVSSTVALAAAANYPAPFVQGGAADVAVVWGSSAQTTDLVAVTDITSNLATKLAAQTASGSTTTGGGAVSGEAVELFTSGKKIYLNDSLNKERSLLTKSNLPIALADGSFQGDVSATYDNKIDIGTTSGENNRLVFGQHPTSDNDPVYAFKLGTTSGTTVYNLTVTFNKAVAFNHSDSKSQKLSLFGSTYTIGSETDGTDLVLLKSSQKISLTNSNPSAEVTVDSKVYTVELVSSSDSAATVKVTDSTGASDSRTIDEGKSKTIKGLEVAVESADETNFALSSTLSVGANKIKLRDNTAVKIGSDEKTLDGTNVRFGDAGSQRPNNITKIVFQISAKDTDVDALTQGGQVIDPVFGSIKLFFTGMTIPEDSTAREDILVKGTGSDRAYVTFKGWEGSEAKTIDFFYNKTDALKADGLSTTGVVSLADGSKNSINVFERAQINKSEYVVVGNENNGGIWRLTTVSNDTSTATKSTIEFKNIMTDETKKATITADGTGTIEFGGRSYTIDYVDSRSIEGDENVRLRYADGSRGTANNAIIYPTIQTSKGAKLFFYEPVTIDFANWDGNGNGTNISALKFPDGDGYTSVAISIHSESLYGGVDNHTWIVGGKALNLSTAAGTGVGTGLPSVYVNIGQLTYNITRGVNSPSVADKGKNNTATIFLQDISNNQTITKPAIVLFEEQDASSSQIYEAVIVRMEGNGISGAKAGVADVERTWSLDTSFDEIQVKSISKLYKSADFWGTVITTDQTDSDSYTAKISYPDQQAYALVYMGETAASASGGTTSGGTAKELGSVVVKDSEVSSVATKNLIVVGGSCVNSVAADLLGSATPLCGADWETKTGVGAGSFLIQTFSRSGGTKVATLVAGYNAGDTTNAAKALTTQVVDTTADKKYTGTTSTTITPVATTV